MHNKVIISSAIACALLVASGGVAQLLIGKAEYIPEWPKYVANAGLLLIAFLMSSAGALWGNEKVQITRHTLVVGSGCFFIIFYIGGGYYKYSQYSKLMHEIESKSQELNPKGCKQKLLSKKFAYYLTGKTLDYESCDGVVKTFRPSGDDVSAREAIQSISNGVRVEKNLLVAWLMLVAIVLVLWLWVAVQKGRSGRGGD